MVGPPSPLSPVFRPDPGPVSAAMRVSPRLPQCLCVFVLMEPGGTLSCAAESRSLPPLSSSALCPRNEQRQSAPRGEDGFLQGAPSPSALRCAPAAPGRERRTEECSSYSPGSRLSFAAPLLQTRRRGSREGGREAMGRNAAALQCGGVTRLRRSGRLVQRVPQRGGA